jgi:hypothetical protein
MASQGSLTSLQQNVSDSAVMRATRLSRKLFKCFHFKSTPNKTRNTQGRARARRRHHIITIESMIMEWTMVYDTQNFWGSEFCVSPGIQILENMVFRELDLFPSSGEGKVTTHLWCPLERAG